MPVRTANGEFDAALTTLPFGNYTALPDRIDEWQRHFHAEAVCVSSGASESSVRGWNLLFRALGNLGRAGLQQRTQHLQALLRENGVTYNVYDADHERKHQWPLDLLPVLIAAREWRSLEQGLNQRALLLDLVLQDLYGPQLSLRLGLIPPRLILAHSGYLRPCIGMWTPTVPPPADASAVDQLRTLLPRQPEDQTRRLLLYAADLTRQADGHFLVLEDRTQAPSGMGYTLENRVVLGRTLPKIYREMRVLRLRPFFRALQRALASQLGTNATPRIVLLTPGNRNETFFEHAFLANYLGYLLVEGGDLTVRGGRVCLKTVDGLQPVDVILRRLDDDYCDPLELRSESLLGVPGLLQAVRSNVIRIANPLGSGILENQGLLAYLPQLCRAFLGEDLILPTVPTWWCGEPANLEFVQANLSQLMIKHLHYPRQAMLPGFPWRFPINASQLDQKDLAQLRTKIFHRPVEFVAQALVPLSTTPGFIQNRLQPCPMVLRTFLVADGSSYTVLPGGLTRVATSADQLIVSNQQGGVSKDTWVLSERWQPNDRILTSLVPTHPLLPVREDLSSRTAENLFWMGRYLERTDSNTRLIRETLIRLQEMDLSVETTLVTDILQTVTHQTGTYPGFVPPEATHLLQEPHPELQAVIFDSNRSGSLRHTVDSLLRCGQSVRDRLSEEMWQAFTRLEEEFQPGNDGDEPLEVLYRLGLRLNALSGLAAESMTRDLRFRFFTIGRRLERGLQTCRLMRQLLFYSHFAASVSALGGSYADSIPPQSAAHLEFLLTLTDSSMTYRRRYRLVMETAAVADLLLSELHNPRSVAFQLQQLDSMLTELPDPPGWEEGAQSLRKQVQAALQLVQQASGRPQRSPLASGQRLPPVIEPESHVPHPGLLDTLDQLQRACWAFSDTLSSIYFSHTPLPHQLLANN